MVFSLIVLSFTSWEGSGLNEVGKEKETQKIRVRIDAKHFRPAEVEFLQGDASKAREKLKWSPRITFHQLVKEMVEKDIELMKKDPTA